MATEITMPKLSDTMEEGTILKWHVSEGDRVARGDIIAEVETDKAAMEMEAFEDGIVTALKVPAGETVAVGTLIAVLDGEGAKGEAKDEGAGAEEAEESKATEEPGQEEAEQEEAEKEETEQKEAEQKEAEQARETEPAEPDAGESSRAPAGSKQDGEETRPGGRQAAASPGARRLAREKNLDLSGVRGTGPGGRILIGDVERALREARPAPEPSTAPSSAGSAAGKSVKIRRIVARKMVESWETIPHFYVTVAVDMTDVIRFRKDLGVTINDFIVVAAARSLTEHPWVNSLFLDGEAAEQKEVNIAMAVATDRGLYNPVLKGCTDLSLREISRRSASLAERAHQGKLAQDDLEGGTFTISNMGMLDVESFSAIITPPQVAVLAVGTARGELVVDEHGETTIAPILRLTLSADHRVLDGADAAEFLGAMKSYLEAPVVLIAGEDGKERD